MSRNAFVDAAVARYARMNDAEKARHNLEQSMPYKQVFSAKQFPTRAAWARFLTLRCAITERLWDEPLSERHEERIGANVLSAREDKDRAIAGFAYCDACHKASPEVERHQIVGAENGTLIEKYLCPTCARYHRIDSMLGCARVTPMPMEG